MIVKRPHILKYTPSETATQNSDGDWLPGTNGTQKELVCRFEPNGSGKSVAGNDGANIVYNGIIYLDANVEGIKYGTSVNVYRDESVIFTGTVINFSNGQFNSRVWV